MFDFLQDISAYCAISYPWLLPLSFALLGLCIGSYLNVVIYRLPLGLSTSKPSRSFCPTCKQLLPWYLNIPLLSWLCLRGKSACCKTPISPRYLVVEAVTSLLFVAIATHYSMDSLIAQALLCFWVAVAVAIFCIDMEKMIVLPSLCLIAAVLGMLVSIFAPAIVSQGTSFEAEEAVLISLLSAGAAFILMKSIALLGRAAFGKKEEYFEESTEWSMRATADDSDIQFTIKGQNHLWSELFMEASHRIVLNDVSLTLKGDEKSYPHITFTAESILLPDGRSLDLQDYEEACGMCRSWLRMREAMGSGDAWIAMAIAALCGFAGFGVALISGSIVGIIWALITRIGRGQAMPFGPCLLTGSFIYLMDWHLIFWDWYCGLIGLD